MTNYEAFVGWALPSGGYASGRGHVGSNSPRGTVFSIVSLYRVIKKQHRNDVVGRCEVEVTCNGRPMSVSKLFEKAGVDISEPDR